MPAPRPSTTITALLGVAAGAAIPGLVGRLARIKLERDVAALRRGDPAPLLRMYADDATLTFPGESSWGRVYRGKGEIEGFLRRFLAAGITGEVEATAIDGPPWDMRLAVQFNDEARDADGTVVYTNRAMIFARLAWGRIVREEVYEDTQRVVAFDDYLQANGIAAPA